LGGSERFNLSYKRKNCRLPIANCRFEKVSVDRINRQSAIENRQYS
jgi:hypothetical protein